MRSFFKKLLLTTLVLATMLPMTACNTPTGEETHTSVTTESSTDAATEKLTEDETTAETEAETEDRSYLCDLPDGLDYVGCEIGLVYVDGFEEELISEELGNGTLADAVYERNLAVENALGVKLVFYRYGDGSATAAALKGCVDSGDSSSEIFTLSADLCMTPVTQGCYLDLSGIGNMDLSKKYWCQGYNDMMTLTSEDRQYVVTSSAAVTLLRLQYATAFNRSLMAERDLPDLYEVVDNGEWTLDYQLSIAKDVYEDVDGNGKESKYDFYGFITGSNVSLDGYCVGAEVPLISRDQNGMMAYSGMEVSDRFVSLDEKVGALYNTHGTYVCNNNNYIMSKFAFDEGLMATVMFSYLESCIYVMDDIDFGLAPLPKLTKEQTDYHTYVEGANTTFGLSAAIIDGERRDMLGAVMEAIAYYSNELVRPAYYNRALPENYLRDARSRRALDDLYENITFDYCFVTNIGDVRNSLRGILADANLRVETYNKKWRQYVKNELSPLMDELDRNT